MRRAVWICATFLLVIALRSTVHAQAAVEAGLGAARAVTTTAPAQGLGKSIGGVFSGLDKALKSGQTPVDSAGGRTAPAGVAPQKKATPKADAVTYEDPKQIQAGLAYDELVRRFGPASMEIAGEAGRRMLIYSAKDGTTQVELLDEKVVSAETAKPRQSAVVVLK